MSKPWRRLRKFFVAFSEKLNFDTELSCPKCSGSNGAWTLNEMGRCSLSKRCSQRLASSSALTIEKLSKNGWLWRQGNVSYDAFYLSSQLSKLYYYCLFFVCFFWSKNRIRNYFSLFMYVYLITIIYSISSLTSVLKREGAALI